MTIKNYGLMWNRDRVHWGGTRANPGNLMGCGPIQKPKKDQMDVNFRAQIGVYILYQNENVVYVGQTGSGTDPLFRRLKQHMADHLADRWDKFSWFGVRRVNQDGTLNRAKGQSRKMGANEILDLLEGLLIGVVEPPLNKQGAKWSDIGQYVQISEGWSAWSDRDLMIEVATKLEIEPE